MVQSAIDFFAPAPGMTKPQAGAKTEDKQVSKNFAKILETEGLRIEEEDFVSVAVEKQTFPLPIQIQILDEFPKQTVLTFFDLIGNEEKPIEEKNAESAEIFDEEKETDEEKEKIVPEIRIADESVVDAKIVVPEIIVPVILPKDEKNEPTDEQPVAETNNKPADIPKIDLPKSDMPKEDYETEEIDESEIIVRREPQKKNAEQGQEPALRTTENLPEKEKHAIKKETHVQEKIGYEYEHEEDDVVVVNKALPKENAKDENENSEEKNPQQREKTATSTVQPQKIEAQEPKEVKEPDKIEKKIERHEASETQTEQKTFSDFVSFVAEHRQTKPDSVQILQNSTKPQLAYQLQNTGRAAFTEGLGNVVRFARTEGIDRATLIVDPPALGKVSVEIISTTKGVEASLKVSSEQVRALVNDQIVQLKQTLAQIGVQVAEFSVDVQQQDKEDGQNRQNQKQKNRARMTDNEEEEKNEEVFRVDLRKGLLHWIG